MKTAKMAVTGGRSERLEYPSQNQTHFKPFSGLIGPYRAKHIWGRGQRLEFRPAQNFIAPFSLRVFIAGNVNPLSPNII